MRAAIDPPGEARADWEIFAAAARAHGLRRLRLGGRRRGLRRVRGADRGPPVRPVRRLARPAGRDGSIQWPCRTREDPGTARLYTDGRFHTADRRARACAPALPGDPADPPDADHPLVLTTGRIASQWHTMTRTGKSPELLASEPEPFVELHPADARRAWLRDGEHARVVSRRGAVTLRVRLDDDACARAPRSRRSTGARCTRPRAPAASTTSRTARPTPSRASPA